MVLPERKIAMFRKTINPLPRQGRAFAALLVISLALCLSLPAVSRAAVPMKMIKAASGQKLQIPEGLPPDKVDGYLAGLSDEQARQVLAYKLKQEAGASAGPAAEKDDQTPKTTFYELAQGASAVMDHAAAIFSGGKSGTLKWDTVVQRLSGGKGGGHLLMIVLIACGAIVERLVLRLTGNLRQQILSTVTSGKLQRLARFISRLVLEAVGIGAYMLTSFVLFIIIFNQEQPGYWVVSTMLIVSYYFWICYNQYLCS